jgi:hypothetical protein
VRAVPGDPLLERRSTGHPVLPVPGHVHGFRLPYLAHERNDVGRSARFEQELRMPRHTRAGCLVV